jgi:hypothetical protein
LNNEDFVGIPLRTAGQSTKANAAGCSKPKPSTSKEFGRSPKLVVSHRNDEHYTRDMTSNQDDEDAVLRQIFDLCSLSPRNTTKQCISFPNAASPIQWLEEFNGLDKEMYLLKDRELESLKEKLEVHRTVMPLKGMCPCGNVENSEFTDVNSTTKEISNQTPSKLVSDNIGFELNENDPIFDDDWDGETEDIDGKQLSTERVDCCILEGPCSSPAAPFQESLQVPISKSDCPVSTHTEMQRCSPILNESSPLELIRGDEEDHTRFASEDIETRHPSALAQPSEMNFNDSESDGQSPVTSKNVQKNSKHKRRKMRTSIFLDIEAQESGDSASSDDEDYDEMEEGEDLESSFVVPDEDENDEDTNTES